MNKRASLLLIVLIVAIFAVSSYFIVFKNLNVFSGNVIDESYSSPTPVCPDGHKNGKEECDSNDEDCYKDGKQGVCQSDCTCSYVEQGCGDGVLQPELGEECDDGNLVNDDGCSSECKKEEKVCGDGIIDEGEECDKPVCVSKEIECEKDFDCISGKMLGNCVKEKSVCEGTNIQCYSNEQCADELKDKRAECIPETKGKCKFNLIECTPSNATDVCPFGWKCANINGDENNCASDCKKECDVELKIKLNGADDPENPNKYVRKTINERFFNPLDSGEITPFDDIDIIAEVSCPNEDYTRFKYDNLEFYTVDDNGITAKIKDLGLSSEDEYTETAKIYRATVTGWASGWTGEEWLIEQIVKKQGVSASLVYNNFDIANIGQALTNCVHLWGGDNAKFKVASMRGKSVRIFPQGIVTLGIAAYENGFHVVDPFKTYKFDFAHYSDLKEHDDSGFEILSDYFTLEVYKNIPGISSCQSSTNYIFYNNLTYSGYTKLFNPVIFLDYSGDVVASVIHEMGHAFAGLSDEYVYKNIITQTRMYLGDLFSNKNCRGSLNAFTNVFRRYGDTFPGCTSLFLHRSSISSLMSCNATRFNVISCGYILQIIKGGNMNDNFEECMKLDTIKPGAECINDADCSTDNSLGCSKCNNNNKCELTSFNNNQASECLSYNEEKTRLEYGLCGRPDASNKGNCVIEPTWECNKEFGGCIREEICVKNSVGDYKCMGK